jgi:hypothetical protein
MIRLRPALLLSLLAALALALSACGGSDESGGGEEASADTDVNELLTQTFTGDKQVDSGNINLKLAIEAEGGEAASQLQGPVSISLAGPFQVQDNGALPKFRLEAAIEGAGQSIKAGATSTGDKGFVSFQGTDYAVDDQVFQQFKAGYEEAQKQAGDQESQQSFATLGMDPRQWLTDPKNEGEAKVGDDDTIKITGGVDVAKLLDDVNKALEQASSLGLSGTEEVPEKLTEQQRQQVLDAVKDPRVEIYTGKDDQILRRMVVNLGVEDADSGTTGTMSFDISITDLNEEQDIAEPADAKPFSELLQQFGGLGLGAAGAGAGAGGGGTDDGGAAAGDIEEYSKCVTDAGDDLDKVRECAELLAAP